MMTSAKYSVSWCYKDGESDGKRHTLFSTKAEPCIAAARVISGNPFAFDIEVIEINTGKNVAGII